MNIATLDISYDLVPPDVQRLIRLAVIEDDAAAASHLDDVVYKNDTVQKLAALLIARHLLWLEARHAR